MLDKTRAERMIKKYGSCVLEPLPDKFELLAKQDMIKQE